MTVTRVLLPLAAFAGTLQAQDVRPETQPTTLGAVVVVAERSPTPMNRSSAAVTRLTAADLARLPYATLADALRSVPGFAIVDFDGLGHDPQLMVRGFYGGGEAEYVLVMVDGRVVNQVHNGTIAWETLPPLPAIESVEIVRGSASALQGDAAVAGVINIVTRHSTEPRAGWRIDGGSYGRIAASLDLADNVIDRSVVASLGFDRTDGYRDHSARASASARATMQLAEGLQAAIRGTWRDFEEPGPLLESLFRDGSESDPLFGHDGGDDREFALTIERARPLGEIGTLRLTVRGDRRRAGQVRTLALAPGFGDTKERELDARRAGLETQLDIAGATSRHHLTLGGSVELTDAESHYFTVESNGDRGAPDASGSGARGTVSVFLHAAVAHTDWLRSTFGARADWIADTFHEEGALNLSDTHAAFSPKVGVNLRYASTAHSSGHAYLSASQTFKAPTLDQLFDQRSIPVPFPPFSLTTANPDLGPQRGTSLEAGLYHDLVGATMRVNGTLSTYQVEMKDELDFDLQTFKYVNIAKSRHRGLEAGLTMSGDVASAFVSLTLQDAVSRSGTNAGNQLKAIPGQILSTGMTLSTRRVGTLSVSLTRTADMYIDDANTRRIPSWTRVDAQVSSRIGSVEVILGARNLLDARINSTGFLDPGGSGAAYYYPAAGRVLTLGVRHGR